MKRPCGVIDSFDLDLLLLPLREIFDSLASRLQLFKNMNMLENPSTPQMPGENLNPPPNCLNPPDSGSQNSTPPPPPDSQNSRDKPSGANLEPSSAAAKPKHNRKKAKTGVEGLASNVGTGSKGTRNRNKGGKRGNPGTFHGEHLIFLQKHVDTYLELDSRLKKTQWLTAFRETWFAKFPWHLGQQPVEFAPLNEVEKSVDESASGDATASVTLSEEARKDLEKRQKLAMDVVQAVGQEVSVLSL